MKYFVIFLFLISFVVFTFSVFVVPAMSSIGHTIQVEVVPDKQVYNAGENVTLTINVPYLEGMTVEISVTKGNTKESIFQTIRSLDGNSTKIEFTLPGKDTFYQYLVYAIVTSPNPNDNGGTAAMIFTKKNADKVLISDLKILKSQASIGESIPISFKVKDGTGNVIPWAEPDIGICMKDAVRPHYVTVMPNSTLSKDSDCPFFQSDFTTTTDEFNIELVVPQDMPEGKYELNIWANPLYTGEHGFVADHKVFDIVIDKADDQVSVIESPKVTVDITPEQFNFLLVSVIGIVILAGAIGFVIWSKKKKA